MIPSCLSRAKSDPRLRGAPLAVYVWCLEHLDVMDFRAVKVLGPCVELHMKRETVIDALRRLVAAGYLVRGAREFRGPWQYRLLVSPTPVKARAA